MYIFIERKQLIMQKKTFCSASTEKDLSKHVYYTWQNNAGDSSTLSFNTRKMNIKIKMQASELQYRPMIKCHLISIRTCLTV